jgi:hypothetical protein
MPAQYEKYPFWMMAMANALSISICAAGLFILAQLGVVFAALYFLYCIYLEINLYRKSCVRCYYYGKACGFGKGKICSFFFKKGDPRRFGDRKMSWKDLLPDISVLVIPLLGGIILLCLDFKWIIPAAMALLLVLSFWGNSFIRGSFTCKHCRQKELGCPAIEWFEQAGKKKGKASIRHEGVKK